MCRIHSVIFSPSSRELHFVICTQQQKSPLHSVYAAGQIGEVSNLMV